MRKTGIRKQWFSPCLRASVVGFLFAEIDPVAPCEVLSWSVPLGRTYSRRLNVSEFAVSAMGFFDRKEGVPDIVFVIAKE